jgi:hypothetical protein
MVEERIRWGLMRRSKSGSLVCVLGVGGLSVDDRVLTQEQVEWLHQETIPTGPPPSRGRAAVALDYGKVERNRRANENLSERLDSAPVDANDIDYLAQRAGERRGRRVSGTGPTKMIKDSIR